MAADIMAVTGYLLIPMFSASRSVERCLLFVFLLLIAPAAIAQSSSNDGYTGYSIEETPDWVKRFPDFNPDLDSDDKGQHGYQFRFSDVQIDARKPGERSIYRMSEYKLTSTRGVENLSQLEFEFDPSYERLVLHDVSILRGEEVINKLDSANIKLLHRERELDSLIYDGRQTLMLLLNDIRVGDTLRYAMNRVGENPVFQGNREFTVSTQSGGAIKRLHRRVLTDNSQPLVMRRLNTDVVPVVSELNGVTDTSFVVDNVEPYYDPEQTPAWRNWRGRLVFSDMQNWSDVVDWALPMYAMESQTPVELTNVAEQIRSAYQTPEEQIGVALQWVQDEVRYFGIELGTNSHRPSAPHETLSRRFGDCKDKTVLLIALLNELGYTAQPALVDTSHGLRNEDQPYRLHAFDHVIAHMELNGVDHWLDPTKTGQRGKVGEMAEPDYGKALILKAGTTELTSMANEYSVWNISVNKSMTISESDTASFTVSTIKNRSAAESIRDEIQNTPVDELTAEYENYYRYYFPTLTSTHPLQYDELGGNQNRVAESYDIASFWELDEDGDSSQWIIADEVRHMLEKPADSQLRREPYRLSHPEYITETIVVDVPWGVKHNTSDKVVSNPYFRFEQHRVDDAAAGTITLKTTYQSLAHEVPAVDVPEFANAVDEAYRQSSMYLLNMNLVTSANLYNLGEFSSVYLQLEWLVLAIPLLFIASMVVWVLQLRHKRPLSQAYFYPVSSAKFMILSIATAGLYAALWFYRNFRYVKASGVKLVPWLRALFSSLFFYSLCQHVDRVVTPENPVSWSKRLSYLLITILILVLYLVSGQANSLLSMSVSIGFASLLMLPLLKRINDANSAHPEIETNNSRWRAYHFLWIAAIVPMFAYDTAVITRILAVGEPIEGSDLWDFQASYLGEVIPMGEDETVQLFYSAEFVDFRRDGNGVTDQRVFSYWADDAGNVQLDIGDRHAITDVATIPAESAFESRTARISFSDGEEIIMYLPDEPAHARKLLGMLRSGLDTQMSSNARF